MILSCPAPDRDPLAAQSLTSQTTISPFSPPAAHVILSGANATADSRLT
jgi:hypothetical protein